MFYTCTFKICFHSTISFYILSLTIFSNTKSVVICYIWAAIIYFNDSMMNCILETFRISLYFQWSTFFCFMKTNGGIKLCISCWHVIDKCIIMHWHRKRKQRQGCAVAEPGGPWLLTSLSGSLQFFLRAQPWMILMTFLYPNVVKFVSELLIIVPWDECKYCFLRGKK